MSLEVGDGRFKQERFGKGRNMRKAMAYLGLMLLFVAVAADREKAALYGIGPKDGAGAEVSKHRR